MSYKVLYGGYDGSDLDKFTDAIAKVNSNEWDSSTPLVFDGRLWSDEIRGNMVCVFLQALEFNTSAETLVLKNCAFDLKTQRTLKGVFDNNTRLKNISIQSLTDEEGNPFIIPGNMFHNCSLEKVTVEKCKMNVESCYQLARRLRSQECKIESLNLAKVAFCQNGLTFLNSAISANTSLRSVSLKSLTQMSKEATSSILTALANNTSITTLSMENMSLGVNHAQNVAELISKNSTLRSLSLRGNKISAEPLSIIMGSGINSNTTLQSLFLSDNPLGDNGVGCIVSSMKKNTSLEILCIANCKIGHIGCSTVARALATFQSLKQLNMDMNKFELCGEDLLQSLKHNQVIEKVLRKLPQDMLRRQKKEEQAAVWDEVDVYLRLNKANRAGMKHLYSLPIGCNAHFLGRSCVSDHADVLFYFLESLP